MGTGTYIELPKKSKKTLLKIKTREMIPTWQTVVLLIIKLNVKIVNFPMSSSDVSYHIILLIGGGWQWRNREYLAQLSELAFGRHEHFFEYKKLQEGKKAIRGLQKKWRPFLNIF